MMMEPFIPDRAWTAAEYLHWESKQEFKNELVDNRVWIMRGANLRHNIISVNLMVALHPYAVAQGYELLGSRMCLEVDPDSTYIYPDLSLVYGEPRIRCRYDQHTFEAPSVIFEIQSSSAPMALLARRRELCLQLESLRCYILISQEAAYIQIFRRDNTTWKRQVWEGLDASMTLDEPACEIALRDVYEKVIFESTG